MKLKIISNNILQIILGVFAILILVDTTESFFSGELSVRKPIDIFRGFLSLLFILGFILSWKHKKIAGIILMIWNVGIWILGLFIDRSGGGMGLVIAVPILIMAAFLLLQWYKTSKLPQPSEKQKRKFMLRALLINYAVLYAVMVYSELTHGEYLDYYSLPGILFPLLLLVFLVGFALSWKREFLAGCIFIFWWAIVFFGTINYYEFKNSGPWIAFGLTILVQGILYIIHFKFKPKEEKN